MKKNGVLIISKVRPSRAWTFANRVIREIPETKIRGIVQYPLRSIPLVQQRMARGEVRTAAASSGRLPWLGPLFRSAREKVSDWLLWFVHGCPPLLNRHKKFTMEELREECARAGWPLSIPSGSFDENELSAVKQPDACLIVLLGTFAAAPKLPVDPASTFIRANILESKQGSQQSGRGASINVEHLTGDSGASFRIASVDLPWQPYDGLLGFTLKTDLIADDLLLQAATALLAGSPESASNAVLQWTDRVLSPCLRQLSQKTVDDGGKSFSDPGRCRSASKLGLDTLLLCSPWILGRNAYRRLSRTYPVITLAHHLVSDRPHRMAVPTEVFWKQVRFLQKHYRIVGLSEAVEFLRSGNVSVPTVALTFDDGYADNFLGLRAVANEEGIPATLFVTTEPLVKQQEFAHDRQGGITGFLPLTWDQVRYWKARGVEFGSHTRTHFDCGSPDLETLRSEIAGSRQDMESQLGSPVALFAFPFGKPQNMSPEAIEVAKSTYSYYASFFGGEGCAVNNGNQSHLLRKRFYSNRWELELELQSVFDQVEIIKRIFQSKDEGVVAAPFQVRSVPALAPSIQSANLEHPRAENS